MTFEWRCRLYIILVAVAPWLETYGAPSSEKVDGQTTERTRLTRNSSVMRPAPKQPKLTVPYHVALHGGPTAMSGRAAEKVLKFVREHGLASASSRRSSRRERQDYVSQRTDYGHLLRPLQITLDNGDNMDFTAISPFALLSRTVNECKPFRDLMVRTLEKHPCSVSSP